MSTPTLAIIAVIILVFTIAVIVESRPKRPRAQRPPHDISDRSRFNAIRKDWEGKQ